MYTFENEEIETIELSFDIIPLKVGENLFSKIYDEPYHVNYRVIKDDYEKNKDKIINDICYHLHFKNIDRPESIENADILIVTEGNKREIVDIVKRGFIKKEVLENINQIDDLYYLHFKLGKLLEDY